MKQKPGKKPAMPFLWGISRYNKLHRERLLQFIELMMSKREEYSCL